jgi:predicted secreted protein
MLPEKSERSASVGQSFTIDLQALPGAGYMWEIDLPGDALELAEEGVALRAESDRVGGPALQRFTLIPRRSGDFTLVFGLKRKWEKLPARVVLFTIHVTP